MFKKPSKKDVQNGAAIAIISGIFSILTTLGTVKTTVDQPTYEATQVAFDTLYSNTDPVFEDPAAPGTSRSWLLYEAQVDDVIDGQGLPTYDHYRPEVRTAVVYTKHEKNLEYLQGKDKEASRIIWVLKRY